MECRVGGAVFAWLSILRGAEWIVNDGETENDQAKNDPVENDGDCMQMRKILKFQLKLTAQRLRL